MNGDNQPTAECPPTVVMPDYPIINSWDQVKLLLDRIYIDSEYATLLLQRLKKASGDNIAAVADIPTLCQILQQSFFESINWRSPISSADVEHLKRLSEFHEQHQHEINRYNKHVKTNPDAVRWPNPTDPNNPLSQFDVLPYVKKTPIMDKQTPIGSAGSCFAFEVAQKLQALQYNYVVTERNDDPDSGILIDGYNAGDRYALFSANYGILFNTPSFKQLAEKAFSIRHFKKLLFKLDNGYFIDPYRENVFFISEDAYENDYCKHIAAVRESLLQCEIFVLTLGLNECWEFVEDGTVMSRNPRANIYPFVKHKVLTVQENIDNIQRFYDIVKSHNPKFKLIISISPIPFLATGRAEDTHVIKANCDSKSVLKVAAEELVNNNTDMYYLPSYEYVTCCAKSPWQPDYRHVTSETVDAVVDMFSDIFMASDDKP